MKSSRARYALVALSTLAYIAASHWLMTRAPDSAWTAVALVGPMLAMLALYGWQIGSRLLAAASLAAVLALTGMAARGGSGVSPPALYLAQHVAIHLALALVFGTTLRSGSTPLISALAMRVHGALSPAMALYTRKLSVVWTVYFVAMAALSVGLFFGTSFGTWAVFANLVTPLALALMFVGEYALRYLLHPEFERASLIDAVRAYSQHSAAQAAPGRAESTSIAMASEAAAPAGSSPATATATATAATVVRRS